MAILTLNFDGLRDLAVDLSVAMRILTEVAVDAVHPLLEVDVLQVDGLGQLLRVALGERFPLAVQEVPLGVGLEDVPEDPAVPVEVVDLEEIEAILVPADEIHCLCPHVA